MVTEITEGVKVSVLTEYQEDYSKPAEMHFVFAYKIRIENNSPYEVQLQARHWNIHDAIGSKKEIHGEGVVGLKPVIQSGHAYTYVSACCLKSGIGKMYGEYFFTRRDGTEVFEVVIPEFQLCVPFRLN